MERISFDSSTHLGQFCLDNEPLRIGCKNMHVSLMGRNRSGAWTDLENGRVDRTIWNLPEAVQSAYYPFMDRFFSIARVDQSQMNEGMEDIVQKLRVQFPDLSLYSRFNLATSIVHQRSKIYTLFAELHEVDVLRYMNLNHGVEILLPFAKNEASYSDLGLENSYQQALTSFASSKRNLLTSLLDQRAIK